MRGVVGPFDPQSDYTIICRADGGIGRGSLVEPDRYSSTPAAQARPSAMAQTISDWPRPASPQAKTPGDIGGVVLVPRHVATLVDVDAELIEHGVALRADEAHGEQHEWRRHLPLGALDGGATLPFSNMTSDNLSDATVPVSSPVNSLVDTE